MSGFARLAGLALLLASLSACGIKGDPAPPEPEEAPEVTVESALGTG